MKLVVASFWLRIQLITSCCASLCYVKNLAWQLINYKLIISKPVAPSHVSHITVKGEGGKGPECLNLEDNTVAEPGVEERHDTEELR